MLLNIRSPRGMKRRITTLGKAQERALEILAKTGRTDPPRKGTVSARGLVRRHTFESLAGSGMARMERIDDARILFTLTAEGERVASALGLRVVKTRGRPRNLGRQATRSQSAH